MFNHERLCKASPPRWTPAQAGGAGFRDIQSSYKARKPMPERQGHPVVEGRAGGRTCLSPESPRSSLFGPSVWQGLVQSLQPRRVRAEAPQKQSRRESSGATGALPVCRSDVSPCLKHRLHVLAAPLMNSGVEVQQAACPPGTPKASWLSKLTSALLLPTGPALGSWNTLPNQPPHFTTEETEAQGRGSHTAGLGEVRVH